MDSESLAQLQMTVFLSRTLRCGYYKDSIGDDAAKSDGRPRNAIYTA